MSSVLAACCLLPGSLQRVVSKALRVSYRAASLPARAFDTSVVLLCTALNERMEPIGAELAKCRPSGVGAVAGGHHPGLRAGERGAFRETSDLWLLERPGSAVAIPVRLLYSWIGWRAPLHPGDPPPPRSPDGEVMVLSSLVDQEAMAKPKVETSHVAPPHPGLL